MRYVVPYSAPGIKWGQLRVEAESSDDALEKAQQIHASTIVLHRHGSGAKSARMTLHKRERSQITYGEPLALVDAVAS